MFRTPCRRKAKLTLQGLVAQAEDTEGKSAESTLYPWKQLSFFGQSGHGAEWRVYDEHGNRLILNGHKIILAVPGRKARRVTLRAQYHAFHQALRQGETVLEMTYKDRRISCIINFLFIAMLAIAFCVCAVPEMPDLLRLWQNDPPLILPEYLGLARIVIVLMVPVILIPSILYLALFYHLVFRPNVIAAHFDGKGLFTKLRDGREIRSDWTDLKDISFGYLFGLHFRSGPTLWFHTNDQRTRMLLSIIEDIFLPGSAAVHAQRARKSLIRVGIYWVVGGCISSAVLCRYTPCDVTFVLCLFIFPILAVVAAYYICRYLQRIENAWLNYKRRRARAQRKANS